MHKPTAKHFSRRMLALSAFALSACATPPRDQPVQRAQLAQAVSPPSRLKAPEPLSATARTILRTRMVSHTREMGELVSAIMLLQYEPIRTEALRISGDASLSRPLSEDATELNSALPEK